MMTVVPEISAVIVTIGDELLDGTTVDTNTQVLAQLCHRRGVTVRRAISVPDDDAEIVGAIAPLVRDPRDRAPGERAGDSVDLCLVTGGLGPTSDDRTAAAVAVACGLELERNADAERGVRAAFERMAVQAEAAGTADASRLRQLGEHASNLDQARLPAGATVVDNALGTAPGFWLTRGSTRVLCMPGVPAELRAMAHGALDDLLTRWFHDRCPAVARVVFRTLGAGESTLAPAVEDVLAAARTARPSAAIRVHYRAAGPEVILTLDLENESARAPSPWRQQLETDVAAALSPWLYGFGAAGLPARVLRVLREHDLSLAVAEACSGGALGELLVAVPGASHCFRGAVVPYDNRVKRDLLGVDEALLVRHGAVSEPTAHALAAAVRRRLAADVGVAVTGIAGPGGGTPDKPVGTVDIAVEDAAGRCYRRIALPGGRAAVQRAAAQWSLKILWDRLVARGLCRPFDLALPSRQREG